MPDKEIQCPRCGQIQWTVRNRSGIEEPSRQPSIGQSAGSPAWRCDSCGLIITRKSAIGRVLEALDRLVPKTP